jgi:hypothetical protein
MSRVEAMARLRARLTAQLLAGEPGSDPVAVAERLLAVQGQDPRGARLAVRARTEGVTAAHVDRALTDQRSLVITWLNRGTLHLVRSDDYPWLHALTAPTQITGNMRRLGQEGVSPEDAERGVTVMERALAEEGPLTREQLRERIAAAGVRTERQALVHVLMRASLLGQAVRGPMVDGHHAYVLVRDWLGEPKPVDRDAALVELARRYLAGHGPASDRDLARWAGLPLRDARAGLEAIASELEEFPGGSGGRSRAASSGDAGVGAGLVDLARRPAAAELPPPRLLGPYDPLLLGWTSREDVLGPHHQLVTVNGLFRPFALVRGRAAAGWSMPRGEVVIEPFGRLRKADAAALDKDAQDVVRFFATG